LTYPNTHSYLGSDISSGLSTNIIIKVGKTTVGAIKSLSISQDRDINVFEEIGTDGIVETCPKGAAKVSVEVERIVFDNLRLPEAFSRGFINIQAQRIPFDIEIIDTSNSENEENHTISIIRGCWFRRYNPIYTIDNFIISERATIQGEYITTQQGGHSTVFGGNREIAFDFDTIERSTDVNGRKGRVDSAGIPLKG
jgi:hypothetical protein